MSRPPTDPQRYATDELLRDGGSIHVRAVRPEDRERLLDHFRALSSRSVYLRYFSARKALTDRELERFANVDFAHDVALVATLRGSGTERIVGHAMCLSRRDVGAPHRAEVAFSVLDEHQGRGIGTVLLEHLAELARARGITEFEADVLGENNRMMHMFARSGFRVARSIAQGVFHVSFPTAETPEYVEASEARERAAAAESIRGLMAPRAVAVVGASRHEGTIGAALLRNLRAGGFSGPIHPVNPNGAEVGGLPAYPDVGSIPGPIDLALIAVPASAVEATVEDCARAGVRGVVVISAGFAESSTEGQVTERRLTALVRGSGMRMIGPNCMGILNTDPAVRLNATFAPVSPSPGNVGMLSQSGALGIALLDHARELNLGLSSFVSVGNKADVSGNDLLAYWGDDPRTGVIVLYLESFGNPRRFARIAPVVARRTPIVAVKSGRSAAGTRAASSHSAALASLDIAVDALFEQAGVIRTDTLEQLFDVTSLLATQPIPRGPRVGVVTNAGGPGILLADACESQGLELPALAPGTLAELRRLLPPSAALANPIDMIASATPSQYTGTIATVGNDPNVDAVVVIYVPVFAGAADEIAAAIAEGAGQVPAEKAVLTVFLSARGAPQALRQGPRQALPSFSFPENAAQALAAAERHGRWRRRPRGEPIELSPFARTAVRAVIDRVLADAREPHWLDPRDLATVLAAVGIRFALAEKVAPADATTAAERLGYPLVAKAVAPGVVHKSDVGGVVLGLQSADAVTEAVGTLEDRMRASNTRLEAVLLQREVAGGIEALVGVTTDATFGPLVVSGLGGVLVELLRDVAFRLPPVTDIDAAEMIDGLRARRLLDGYRGAPPGDRAALIDVVLRVSALVEIVPELRELDLNPVKILAPGEGAVAVDGRMRIGLTDG